jgi:branched-chain amino acid transport system substrate-binding protein
LADRWADQQIAIAHDGELYGQGLAEETKKALNARGVEETLLVRIEPGRTDYYDVVDQMRALGIDVLYYAGYAPEAALIIRQARALGSDLQLIGGDGIATEDFGLIAGPAGDGTLFSNVADPRGKPEAAPLLAAFRGASHEPNIDTFLSYATVQVWAQAVEEAGTMELDTVVSVLRHHELDTVLGRIGFDAKGDVTGYDTFAWYVWQGGDYVPAAVD